ncbi:MAG: type IV pili twitching motility protein PilT, partial [Lachnospiraceae bacterium]|nr:type IV pili twitching motility protein PilT [Lachnospiraceae bacterium]
MALMSLEESLRASMERKASDVHYSVGRPIMLRIDGDLVELDDNVLKPNDVESYFVPILSENQKKE